MKNDNSGVMVEPRFGIPYLPVMPTYAWTAKDKSGMPVFREIQATSVKESRDALLAEGCTDLQLPWLEGDFENARRELEAAIEGMEKTRHIPFRTGNIAVAKAYLCCVQARLGNPAAAQKCWQEARAYLIATKETKLLDNCKAALGIA
jgi:hypothetical protein